MEEIWKEIKNTNGKYFVSNLGRVRNSSRILSQSGQQCHDNVLYVSLLINGEKVRRKVSRLVADAFLNNPHGYTCVCHKDSDPQNNRADNLMWLDPSGVAVRAAVNGKINGYKNRITNLRPVKMISNDIVKEFQSEADCAKYMIDHGIVKRSTQITSVTRQIRWAIKNNHLYGGCIFEYCPIDQIMF